MGPRRRRLSRSRKRSKRKPSPRQNPRPRLSRRPRRNPRPRLTKQSPRPRQTRAKRMREKKEEDPAKKRADLLKKVKKEGGKRGVEIEGAADMGGLQFFCSSVDLPEGDMELLVESMKAMNAKSDPTEEERKGGSGHIGKMIFSAGTEQLAIAAYVPEAKQGDLSCEEWLKSVLGEFGGEVLDASKGMCTGRVRTN